MKESAFCNDKRKVSNRISFYYTSLHIISSSFSGVSNWVLLDPRSGYKGISANPVAKLLLKKSSSFPHSSGERIYSPKICLRRILADLLCIPKHRSVHRLRYGIKKKSEIMRSIVKNRKHGSNLPISIKLVLKIALVVLGFCVWRTGFVWALVGLYLFLPILRGILCLFVGLGAIILFLFAMLTFL